MIPDLDVTGVFIKNWKSTKKIVVNRGGTRSSKTYSILQLIAVWLFTGQIREGQRIEKGVASVVRKFKSSLKATSERDFEEILKDYDLYRLVDHNKTNRTFSYDGRLVQMFGADDQQKIRGYKSDILFCNEANELGYKTEFFQLLMRTTGVVFIDFNPSDPYVWINEEIEQKRAHGKGDVDVIVSTYKDNGYLLKPQIDEIEYLQQTDEELWQVYGLGQYGKVHGLIFPNITIIDKMPDQLRFEGYGQDFGFTNDVSALSHGGVLHGRDLFLDELMYETGLTNPDISNYYKSLGISKTAEIYADSAEPKSIAELRRYRWNIRAAKKGRDSVKFGIDLLKTYNIHITARSTNFLREQKKYKWKQDSDGNWLNEPIDLFNHLWDSARYYGVMKLSKVAGGGTSW